MGTAMDLRAPRAAFERTVLDARPAPGPRPPRSARFKTTGAAARETGSARAGGRYTRREQHMARGADIRAHSGLPRPHWLRKKTSTAPFGYKESLRYKESLHLGSRPRPNGA
ncbi:MAG: hypothetical protein Kow00122_11240 [Thermoleophilia bacterium]